MSFGLADFTVDPSLSYLERTLIRSNVTSNLCNFCLRLYRGDELIETIDFDWTKAESLSAVSYSLSCHSIRDGQIIVAIDHDVRVWNDGVINFMLEAR